MEGIENSSRQQSLSIYAVTFGISAILYSWCLFFLLSNAWSMVFTLPFWLGVPLLIGWIGRKKGLMIRVKRWQHWFFWPLVIVLIVSAPIYSYLYGFYHVTRLLNSFQIEASIVKQEAVLLDRFGDIGPARRFYISYELLESVDEAEAKIRDKLGERPEWFIGWREPDHPLIATCPQYGMESKVVLSKSRGLGITLEYRASAPCRNLE